MALSIKNDEADRLARELAEETGESITDAVLIALRERLDRERRQRDDTLQRRIAALIERVATLPIRDDRSADEIIGYDENGLPS